MCKTRFSFILQDHKKKEICYSLKQLSPGVPLNRECNAAEADCPAQQRVSAVYLHQKSLPFPGSSSSWKEARQEHGIRPCIYLSVASFFVASDQHIGSGCESCCPELALAAVGGQRGDCAPSFAPVPLPIRHSERYNGILCCRDCVLLFWWGGEGVIIFVQWELAIWNKLL